MLNSKSRRYRCDLHSKYKVGRVGGFCKICNRPTPCQHGETVILNVYDMMRFNEYTKPLGLGVFHTGIEVYGLEYGFAGSNSRRSGIFVMTPRRSCELGANFRYNQSILMGVTHYTREEVIFIIADLSRYFPSRNYHLTNCNCNHFTNVLSQVLCGHKIPNWVNRLAKLFKSLLFLKRLLPRDTRRQNGSSHQHQTTEDD